MGERWLVTRLLIAFIKHTKMCGRLATHRTKPSYPVLEKKKAPACGSLRQPAQLEPGLISEESVGCTMVEAGIAKLAVLPCKSYYCPLPCE